MLVGYDDVMMCVAIQSHCTESRYSILLTNSHYQYIFVLSMRMLVVKEDFY